MKIEIIRLYLLPNSMALKLCNKEKNLPTPPKQNKTKQNQKQTQQTIKPTNK